MKFDLSINQNKKIGLFTDCHIGVQKDNQIRLNETKKCFKWIIQIFKKNNIDWVIFCGDLFDSRFSINVQTLNYAFECIQELSYNFEKIFLIIGNHDTFYKNNNSVTSVNIFSKISETNNIIIIDQKPFFIQMIDKSLGLFPWGYDLENYKNQPCDFGFGHFQVNGVDQFNIVSSGSKYHWKDLKKLSSNIYSGHYHNESIYKNRKNIVYMLGDPLQLNWGEYNKEKYIYSLDCMNNQFERYKNQLNSRFEKIFYSMFQKDEYNKEKLQKLCEHNFCKLIIDTKYQFENVLKYADMIKELKPITFQIEYLISLTSDIILQSTDEIVKSNSKDNKAYLLEYIRNIYKQIKEVDDTINLDILNQLIIQYYQKTQQFINQEEQD